MAAGKNAASSILEELGFYAIDFDLLAHEALIDLTPTILSTFGNLSKERGLELLNADKKLNRRALGELLFSDKKLLKIHEEILFPAITKKALCLIKSHKGTDIVLNAAVLYKTKELLSLCDRVLYIKANVIKRINRVRERDHLPLNQTLARFLAQKRLLKEYKKAIKSIRSTNETKIKSTQPLNNKIASCPKISIIKNCGSQAALRKNITLALKE